MELYQIRYFLAVADTMNFTRASERSFVSQPALTKAIQRLEETIGGRLFDRTKNSVQLTELGQAMLPSFRQIYDNANQAREQARRLTRGRRSRVKVGVMCTIGPQILSDLFIQFGAAHPNVELEVQDKAAHELLDAVQDSDLADDGASV